MELLSNNSMSHGSNSSNSASTSNQNAEQLLAGILDSFPSWDITARMMPGSYNVSPPRNNDFFLNNFFGTQDTRSECFGATTSGMHIPKVSPKSDNAGVSCGWCDVNASIRCLDCNEFMCKNCWGEHSMSPVTSNHSTIPLPAPIGTSPTGSTTGMPSKPTVPIPNYMCDLHNEMFRYVCEYCKKLVCQCCTLREHKEHNYVSIQSYIDESQEKIDSAIESSRVGTKCIKSSIDKALAFIRLLERNCMELSDNIRKAFRQFIVAIDDRERFLLDYLEKSRQRRLAILHDQMAGLKSALSGLAETSEMLHKTSQNTNHMDHIDIAMKLTHGQRQLEQFAEIYKDLQPKHEVFAFAAPDYTLLQDISLQGGVILMDEKNLSPVGGVGVVSADIAALGLPLSTGISSIMTNIHRPILHDSPMQISSPQHQQQKQQLLLQQQPQLAVAVGSSLKNSAQPDRIASSVIGGSLSNSILDWELNAVRASPGLHTNAVRPTQCIAGSSDPVRIRNSNALSYSFAVEGHDDGQVSRPWGLCVDKFGNIIVSDRRNNRVQIFNPNGTLKLKFGRKGSANGEFDLPAGITVDIDNRIIVVDKDNHRVQIFTSTGVFLNKFGSAGKEYGQFQYPWDVAVNSRRQIVVTDSRNHRIQQFDSEGRFIRQIVFDNNRGIASPRGVCYTPQGNIIVSDFDNHCLYLIDPDVNKIIAVKGREGSGSQQFNRPSGLCCDDDGRIIVADSKNQRIMVFSSGLEYLWHLDIRPSTRTRMPDTLDEKDRSCDVALLPDGRVVFLIELSPDSKEGSNPDKNFVYVF